MEERLKQLAISNDESANQGILNGGTDRATPRLLPINQHLSFSLDNSNMSDDLNDNSILNHTTSDFKPSEHQQSSTKRSIKKKARLIFPAQQKNYGPKATLKKVTDEYLVLVQDPLSLQLSWTRAPLYVLVIKKVCDTLFEPYSDMIKYLIYNHNMIVYVEEKDYDNEIFTGDHRIKSAMGPSNRGDKPSLRKFSKEVCANRTELNKIDFIVCLGGDGTLLHVSNLFQASCPPVLSVHMGSLGFLCPFDFDRYKEYLSGVIKGGVPLLLRNRLKCRLERSSDKLNDSTSSLNNASINNSESSGSDICCNYKFMDPEEQEEINKALVSTGMLSLNEIVVSRGPSPFLTNLDLYINDYLITTVQGDGLIISTPTGSTAYAMAAGASMCHPSVQSIIIAPICPHSLSFRPIVVPAGVELKVCVSPDARHNSWFSVDGRNLTELKHGFHLSITTSEYPLPSICRSDQINDWFEGLATCLHWNQRQKQLPLNSCYLQSNSLMSASQTQLNPSLMSRSSSNSSIKQSNNITNGVYHNTNNNLNSTVQIDPNSIFKMTPKPEFHLDEESHESLVK